MTSSPHSPTHQPPPTTEYVLERFQYRDKHELPMSEMMLGMGKLVREDIRGVGRGTGRDRKGEKVRD